MTELAPLACAQCGSPVPLSDESQTSCVACHAFVPIPAGHRAVRAAAARARAARQETEAALRAIAADQLPAWIPKVWVWVIVIACVGVPVAMAFTQSRAHWGPRHWIVLGGLVPLPLSKSPKPVPAPRFTVPFREVNMHRCCRSRCSTLLVCLALGSALLIPACAASTPRRVEALGAKYLSCPPTAPPEAQLVSDGPEESEWRVACKSERHGDARTVYCNDDHCVIVLPPRLSDGWLRDHDLI